MSSNQSPLHLMVLLGICLHTTLLLDLLSLSILMDGEISFPTIINNEIGPTIMTLVESMQLVHHRYSWRVSPFQVKTVAESRAKPTAMAWSRFDKILHEHQWTWAPRAVMVSLRTNNVLYLSSIDCGFGLYSSQFSFVWLCLDRKKMKENNKDFCGFIFIFKIHFFLAYKTSFFFWV